MDLKRKSRRSPNSINSCLVNRLSAEPDDIHLVRTQNLFQRVGCSCPIYNELSAKFSYFSESIDKIADRLLGPFNIEAVVEPINIKISEAIMNFQENGATISEKIFVSCGKPNLERRRRTPTPEKGRTRAKDELATDDVLNFNQKKKHKKTQSQANISTLEKLIRDIKQVRLLRPRL